MAKKIREEFTKIYVKELKEDKENLKISYPQKEVQWNQLIKDCRLITVECRAFAQIVINLLLEDSNLRKHSEQETMDLFQKKLFELNNIQNGVLSKRKRLKPKSSEFHFTAVETINDNEEIDERTDINNLNNDSTTILPAEKGVSSQLTEHNLQPKKRQRIPLQQCVNSNCKKSIRKKDKHCSECGQQQ